MTTPTLLNKAITGSVDTGLRRARRTTTLRAVLLPLAGLLLVVLVWWLSVIGFRIDRFLLPSPADVWNAFMANPGFLLTQTWVTFVETVQGFLLAIVIGVPIAMVIASSKLIEQMIYPLLLAINAAPKVAIAPLLVVWMGFGQAPKVVMVVLLCFFPIVLSTTAGLRSTPSEFIELAKSLNATPLQTFVKFRAPFALEQIFVGLKTAISLAVIGAVIAEFVGASEGLGYLIVQSGSNANTALAFVAIVLLALMSIVLFYVLVFIERLLIPWAESQRAAS
ncbi:MULTISPECIES: ABC transporter permease [unclassified Microbacterium]|uniref:ABC transporter permease n=1 Tax=unclassified Microbacterium TaxID=2609290 RepID=UPI00300FF756